MCCYTESERVAVDAGRIAVARDPIGVALVPSDD